MYFCHFDRAALCVLCVSVTLGVGCQQIHERGGSLPSDAESLARDLDLASSVRTTHHAQEIVLLEQSRPTTADVFGQLAPDRAVVSTPVHSIRRDEIAAPQTAWGDVDRARSSGASVSGGWASRLLRRRDLSTQLVNAEREMKGVETTLPVEVLRADAPRIVAVEPAVNSPKPAERSIVKADYRSDSRERLVALSTPDHLPVVNVEPVQAATVTDSSESAAPATSEKTRVDEVVRVAAEVPSVAHGPNVAPAPSVLQEPSVSLLQLPSVAQAAKGTHAPTNAEAARVAQAPSTGVVQTPNEVEGPSVVPTPEEVVSMEADVNESVAIAAAADCADGVSQDPGYLSAGGSGSLSVVQASHIIQIGDELEILFPYQPVVGEQTSQRLQNPPAKYERVVVRDDGMITAPLLPPVPAVGRTPEELRANLISLYRELAYDPVAARESNSKRVYRISVNDSIEVRIRQQDDLNDVVLVAPDGRISLQRIGIVVAEGKTIEELQQELTERYSKVIPQPEITVTLRDFHSSVVYVNEEPKRIGLRNLDDITVIARAAPRSVYVLGEVHAPRQVVYQGSMTLAQALASAGGHMRTAKIKSVRIIRRDTPFSEPRTFVVDYRPTLWGTAGQDIPLQNMDVVILGKTPIAVVTDVLEQYLFNIVPFTRNNPNFNLFYSLGGGAGGGIITSGAGGTP